MKNILIHGVLICSGFTFFSAQAADKNYSLTLTDPSKPAQVDIELRNGSVTIIGYEGNTIEISATTSPSKHDAQTKLEKKIKRKIIQGMTRGKEPTVRSVKGLKPIKLATMHLEIEEQDNEVDIVSETSNQHVALVIKVPYQSSIDAEVYLGGGISVDNISGNLELEAYQGEVIAKGVSGPIVAETATDDIVIELAQFNDTTPTSLTSQTGNIDITLNSDTKANINVKTYQGEIFSGLANDFIATDRIEEKNNGKKKKIIVAGALQAKVNGGGQDISLATYTGNLYIRSK